MCWGFGEKKKKKEDWQRMLAQGQSSKKRKREKLSERKGRMTGRLLAVIWEESGPPTQGWSDPQGNIPSGKLLFTIGQSL